MKDKKLVKFFLTSSGGSRHEAIRTIAPLGSAPHPNDVMYGEVRQQTKATSGTGDTGRDCSGSLVDMQTPPEFSLLVKTLLCRGLFPHGAIYSLFSRIKAKKLIWLPLLLG